MNIIRVYLSARIAEDAHAWNIEVCRHLKDPFDVFLPQHYNPWQMRHEDLPMNVFEVDLQAMKNSDMGLLLPEYGRDCAWEAGWYANSSKPLVIFANTRDGSSTWLRDWMVKGGAHYFIALGDEMYEILKKDPIVSRKSILKISALSDIHTAMLEIHARHYGDASIHRAREMSAQAASKI